MPEINAASSTFDVCSVRYIKKEGKRLLYSYADYPIETILTPGPMLEQTTIFLKY